MVAVSARFVAGKLRFIIPLLIFATILFAPFASLPQSDAQDSTNSHIVQSGENLYRIALRYGITVNDLAAANNITDPTRIYVGQILIIPTEAPATSTVAPVSDEETPLEVIAVAEAAPSWTYHIVQPSETLTAIAEQYGTTWQEVMQLNNLVDPNQVFAGQRLIVGTATVDGSSTALNAVAGPTIVEAAPVEEPAAVSQTYVVQSGDTLASIAQSFNINWTTISRANSITNPNTIYAGQELVIPAVADATGTYLEPNGGVPAVSAPTVSTGKQIVINLTEQQVYAYEDGELLRTMISSSGLPGTPTVTGEYRIYWKLTSQTMSGPGYYLPGVPWVMYFYQGYALHGTYWHNNFGQPMSHGCVNLPTSDAEWLFRWAEIGTPVSVRY